MEYGLRPGQHVYTLDGDDLGRVKEVREEYFKVDTTMKPDYWLSVECIRGGAVAGDRVQLTCNEDELDDYKADLD